MKHKRTRTEAKIRDLEYKVKRLEGLEECHELARKRV